MAVLVVPFEYEGQIKFLNRRKTKRTKNTNTQGSTHGGARAGGGAECAVTDDYGIVSKPAVNWR